MTSESCANGTERCAEALAQLDGTPDLIVNLQGDAPLTPHWFLEELIAAMRERQDVAVATPVLRCDQQTYTHFKDDRAVGRVGGRSEEHTSELQSLMRISYAVFCLKKIHPKKGKLSQYKL